MVSLSRSKYVGRIHEASCRRGTGAAPAGDGGRNLVPGPCSGSLAGHYEPARSDHGQTPKGKDAALVRRKARGVTLHAQSPALRARPGSHALSGRSGEIQAMRLVARHPPRFSRETEARNAGDPLAPSRKQGTIFFGNLQCHGDHSCRVGKGAGTATNTNERLSCAMPTNGIRASWTIHGGHGARQAFAVERWCQRL